MKIDNNIYQNFQSYEQHKSVVYKMQEKAKKIKCRAVIGSAIGVAASLAVTSRIPKPAQKSMPDEVMRMLAMAGAANVGGVLCGSIGATKEQKINKWQEAGFQMLNTTIPMFIVSSALAVCKRVKPLNNVPAKIIASIAAMGGGAALATQISNLTNGDNEPDRKYTIKDSVANFDDIVATAKLGFENIEKYIPVDKFLPFVYIYCGQRAGSKE